MFVKSTAKLIPCVSFSHTGDIFFYVYSTTDEKYVEFKGDKYNKKGEILGVNDSPGITPLFLTDDDTVRQAAKELLKLRPEPFGSEVAAVMLRDEGSTGIHWYRISNKGTLKLFGNADPIDITNLEDGDTYSGTKTQIFFSPISAINTVKNYLENVCNDIINEATERENKEQQDIINAKPFIEKLHKAQEI